MSKFRSGLCFLLCLILGPALLASAALAQDPADVAPRERLILGVMPANNPAVVFSRYGPLVNFLSEQMKTRIDMEAAPNMELYRMRVDNRHFDLLLTEPHLVVQALDSGHYNLLASPQNTTTAVVVVSESGTVSKPDQLAGKVVATTASDGLITLAGIKVLESLGLTDARKPVYMATIAPDMAFAEVLAGQADAAIIPKSVLDAARKQGKKLKTLGSSDSLPGIGILAAKDLPEAFGSRLQKLLLAMKSGPKGRTVLKQLGFDGFKAARASEYNPMRVYLPH